MRPVLSALSGMALWKGGTAINPGNLALPKGQLRCSLEVPPRQSRGEVMPTLTASAPWADASSAVMAQAKTNRWGSQANNEMNSEAH